MDRSEEQQELIRFLHTDHERKCPSKVSQLLVHLLQAPSRGLERQINTSLRRSGGQHVHHRHWVNVTLLEFQGLTNQWQPKIGESPTSIALAEGTVMDLDLNEWGKGGRIHPLCFLLVEVRE